MLAQYLMTSAIALTLYDYLLTLDDEVRPQTPNPLHFHLLTRLFSKIRYVWRGRKTWSAFRNS